MKIGTHPLSVSANDQPLAFMLIFCVVCLLAVPWLNPYTFGPMPSAVPWLISAFCGLVNLGVLIRVTADTSAETWSKVVARAWIIAAAFSAVIAMIQYFGVSAALSPWINSTAVGEAYGNLRQRNQFASLTNIGVAALVWSSQKPRWRMRWLSADLPWVQFLIVLLVSANAASASRTGIVQLVIVLIVFAAWHRGSRPVWTDSRILAAAMGYAVAALLFAGIASVQAVGGGILGRMQDVGTHCSSRLVLWSNVFHLISLHPWRGWGWGELDFAHFVTLYPGERFCDILDNAHNLPLHLAVELGLPVAIATVGLLVWWVLRNKPWSEQNPTRQMAWAVLAVIGLHSLLEYPLWYGPFQLAVGLCVLLLWRTRPGNPDVVAESPSDQSPEISFGAVSSAVAVFMLVILVTVVWDYWRVSQLYLLPADRAANYRDNTLAKVRNSWFFQDQVEFAELTTVTLNSQNAAEHYTQALRLLHFSPEPRVIEAVIESAVMLGKDQEAFYYLQRYQAAFPQEHATWVARSAHHKTP